MVGLLIGSAGLLGVLYIVTKVVMVAFGKYILRYFVNSDIIFMLREFDGNNCTATELETDLISPLVNLSSWMVKNEYEFSFSPYLKSAIIYTDVLLNRRTDLMEALEGTPDKVKFYRKFQYIIDEFKIHNRNLNPIDLDSDPYMAWVLDACFGAYYAAQDNDIFLKKILSTYYFFNLPGRARLALIFAHYYKNPGKCQPKSFKEYVLDEEKGFTYIRVPEEIRNLSLHPNESNSPVSTNASNPLSARDPVQTQ